MKKTFSCDADLKKVIKSLSLEWQSKFSETLCKVSNNNNNRPPGVFIVFGTLLFFTITIHTATDKSADDVGNYYVELAETWSWDLRAVVDFPHISAAADSVPFVLLYCLGPVAFAQVVLTLHALANPVGSHILDQRRSIVCTPVFPRRDSNSRPHHWP